jgi:hypothetical protein
MSPDDAGASAFEAGEEQAGTTAVSSTATSVFIGPSAQQCGLTLPQAWDGLSRTYEAPTRFRYTLAMRAIARVPATLAAALVACPAVADSQQPRPPSRSFSQISEQWSQPLSPSVVGTFILRDGQPAAILLWRGGKPGWFLGAPRQGSGGGSGDGTIRGSETFGATRVEYRLLGAVAEIQGVAVDLSGGKNVLLVDHVDADPSRLTIAAIAAPLPTVGRGTPLRPVFDVMPDALAFLRCGEPLPDEQLKIWNRFVCDGADK